MSERSEEGDGLDAFRAAAAVRARSAAAAAGGDTRAAPRAVTAGAAGGVARGDVAVASPAEMSPGAVASPAEMSPAEMSLAAVYSSPAHDPCRLSSMTLNSEPLSRGTMIPPSLEDVPCVTGWGLSDEEWRATQEARRPFKGLPFSRTPYTRYNGKLEEQDRACFCAAGFFLWRLGEYEAEVLMVWEDRKGRRLLNFPGAPSRCLTCSYLSCAGAL
jgi:hypothetical protein